MEEPKRESLLDVVNRSLEAAGKRSFTHRIMYLICYTHSAEIWIKAMENSLKVANIPVETEEKSQRLAGLGLVFPGYVVVVIEGNEDVFLRHLEVLFKECQNVLPGTSWKVMVYVPHINRQMLSGWVCVSVNPPVLLEALPKPKDPVEHTTLLLHCVNNIYRVMQAMTEFPVAEARSGYNSLSVVCRQILPNSAYLDLLYNSPILSYAEEFFDRQEPLFVSENERVWPVPSPYN